MKSNEKKIDIIISLPLVWTIRNFILSGITTELSKKFNIFYAVPDVGINYLLAERIPLQNIIILSKTKTNRLHQIFFKILKEAFLLRNPLPENEVFLLRAKKNSSKNSKTKNIIKFIAKGFISDFVFDLLNKIETWLYVDSVSNSIDGKIRSINPSLAISTAFVVDWEWSLFRVLHKNGVPVWTHILSFDNLTSRGFIPIHFFDKYLVWNERMKQELVKYYRIDANKIEITGTPQFDFHKTPIEKYSSEIPNKWLNIANKGFILYCANHKYLTPREPELLKSILLHLRQEKLMAHKSVVLRLHPMDDYSRWNDLLSSFPEVVLNVPWEQPNHEETFWGNPSLEDLRLFSYLLRSADIVLHIASTIAIDAAVTDTPSICVGFHSDSGSKEDYIYYNFHFSNHYKPIIDSGACAFADSMEKLMDQIKEEATNKKLRSRQRQELANYFCNGLEEFSGERIIELVICNNSYDEMTPKL